jgi:hypothetical protein
MDFSIYYSPYYSTAGFVPFLPIAVVSAARSAGRFTWCLTAATGPVEYAYSSPPDAPVNEWKRRGSVSTDFIVNAVHSINGF